VLLVDPSIISPFWFSFFYLLFFLVYFFVFGCLYEKGGEVVVAMANEQVN